METKIKVNIINGCIVKIPFDESKPYILLTKQELFDIENGRKIINNGLIVDNPIKIDEEINVYKKLLKETDYICLKWCEGEISEIEYEYTKTKRKEYRLKINQLEQLKRTS